MIFCFSSMDQCSRDRLKADSAPQTFTCLYSDTVPLRTSKQKVQTDDEMSFCLRCKSRVCDRREPIFAEIAHKSIYSPRDCSHGPFCRQCSVSLDQSTLSLCPGCGALISRVKLVNESDLTKEAVDTAIRTNGRSEPVQPSVLIAPFVTREAFSTHSQCTSIAPGYFASANCTVFVPGSHSHVLSATVPSATDVHDEEFFFEQDCLRLQLQRSNLDRSH